MNKVDRDLHRTQVLRRISRISKPIRDFGYVITMVLAIYAALQAGAAGDKANDSVEKLINERTDRRAQVNESICSLVRAVPPGNDRIDAVRKNLRCGDYEPPGLIPSRPSRTPRPSITPSSIAPPTLGSLPQAPSSTPSASAQRTPAPASSRAPSTTTRTKVIRSPPVTVTRTPRPVIRAPSSQVPILSIPGCSITLLGIPVCKG